MMWYAMARMGVWPATTVVKVDDTPAGIGEGVAAGTWTVGLSLTGNMCGLSAAELAALSEAERDAHSRACGGGADGRRRRPRDRQHRRHSRTRWIGSPSFWHVEDARPNRM